MTPGREAEASTERLDHRYLALPKIPVQPIGWDAANEILSRMRGTPAPSAWQGGLPHYYRLEGGDALQVRLHVEQRRRVSKTANVLGVIPGEVHPDERVIIGCHFDAWTFGAGDPHAGTIILYECARAFAEAAEAGMRPDRTLVFANWGAEEYGIIGSTEYCEANAEQLRENGVAYINLDMAAMGLKFRSSAAPLLKSAIAEATQVVQQPGSSQTVFDRWRGSEAAPRFGNLGGGSDHVGFYCHLGIPSCGIAAGGSDGVSYHSNYDTLPWYRKVVGDDYQSAAMLTRIVNVLVARLANADVIPFDVVQYVADVRLHMAGIEEAGKSKGRSFPSDVQSRLTERLQLLELAGRRMNSRLLRSIEADRLDDDALATINRELRTLERCWLSDEGLPDRSWYRSLYAASDPFSGYAAWMLPALRLAVVEGGDIKRELERLLKVTDRLYAKVNRIDDALGDDDAED